MIPTVIFFPNYHKCVTHLRGGKCSFLSGNLGFLNHRLILNGTDWSVILCYSVVFTRLDYFCEQWVSLDQRHQSSVAVLFK